MAGKPTAMTAQPISANCNHTFVMGSAILNEDRRLYVRLPDSYDTGNQRYPVLYMLDGELPLFTSHGGVIAQLAEWEAKIPEMILVAIPNTDRPRDMIPVAIELPNGRHHGGGADRFLEFVSNELVPAIDETYRTHPYRILSGTSASGLAVAHAMATGLPGFRAFVASSPTVGTSDRALFDRVASEGISGEAGRFFAIFTGDDDMDGIEKDCQDFSRLLQTTVGKDQLQVAHWVHENEGHCPFDGFRRSLLALYDAWQPSTEDLEVGLEAIQAHYQRLSEQFGYPGAMPIGAYESVGERLIGSARPEAAVEILMMGMEQHSDSPRIAFYLAIALARSDQRLAAKALLERLLMNDRPGNNRLKGLLRQLVD